MGPFPESRILFFFKCQGFCHPLPEQGLSLGLLGKAEALALSHYASAHGALGEEQPIFNRRNG